MIEYASSYNSNQSTKANLDFNYELTDENDPNPLTRKFRQKWDNGDI